MCGLAGILSTQAPPAVRAARAAAMGAQIVHRGPDAGDVWGEGAIALSHRRLAILDLSAAGAQPMHSADGRFVIAYNGEVYNHLDLRVDLEAQGAAPEWRGHSDTETLLAAVQHWGLDETLCRAAGMFAIALWDRAEKRLFLARDRMGEKPLYWGWAGTDLVFGSELKALRAHPALPRDIDPAALALYLQFAYVPAPYSIHPGVYKLEPGCILEVTSPPKTPPSAPLRPGDSHGSLSLRRYWSLSDTATNGAREQIIDPSAAVEATKSSLQGAVERQMISDVPLGAFLSGGVDSSLIAALMQAGSMTKAKTFTIGFENKDYDEASFARAVAEHLGTDHTEMTLTDADAQNVIPALPHMYDEPFADSSQIPTHLVCKAARAEVTVALSGDAGDELFGGYNRYTWGPDLWRRIAPLPKPIRRIGAHALSALSPEGWDQLAARVGSASFAVSRPGIKIHKLAQAMKESESPDDLYASLVRTWHAPLPLKQGAPVGPIPLTDPLPQGAADDAPARMMLRDMASYLPDDILCKVDRAAMSVSLETRVPMLDPKVIETAARLPVGLKIRDGQSKWPLRQILYSYVPRDLIERPKIGFSIPLGDWLRGPLRDWADALLSENALARIPSLDAEVIRRTWAEHLGGRRDYSVKLWVVLMLSAWLEDLS